MSVQLLGHEGSHLASARLPRRSVSAVLAGALLAGAALGALAQVVPAAASFGSISGTVFQDTNRNGVQDAGEAPWSGINIYLFTGSGTYVAGTPSDASGLFSFSGLSDGSYQVDIAPSSWTPLELNWVPTTTGSIHPAINLSLSGSATANFGLRQIVRSTTLSSPISHYVGPSGLTVNSYDDVVDATTLYNDVMTGSLIGNESAAETIRFDYGSSSFTTPGTVSTNGNYTSESSATNITYDSWVNSGDEVLFHEYGIAWGAYYTYLMQQDGSMVRYLQARSLLGDPRIGSSQAWDPYEMIGEDYRELFGSANAQATGQMNLALPPASQVPGLKTFLSTTFTSQAPSFQVQISSPGASSTLSGTANVSGFALSPVGISKSAISVDSGSLLQASAPTYWTGALGTAWYPNGTHTVTATAYDSQNNPVSTSESMVFSNPTNVPVIAISAPSAGASLAGNFTVSGQSFSQLGVSRVVVQVDSGTAMAASGTTAWSAGLSTLAYASGAHTLTANVFDSQGDAASASVSVTFNTPAPVAITSLSASPTTVRKSCTVSFGLSAPATVSLNIVNALGQIVRHLLSSVSEPQGTSSVSWDRLTDSGARAKSGTYTIVLQSTDQYGRSAGASTTITVS